MFWKRIAILTAAGAAFGAAAPAFADGPYWGPANSRPFLHHAPRGVAVYPRPFVVARPASALVYRAPVYYAPPPMPVYGGYRHYDYGASGALVGAVAGALIGSSIAYGDQRFAGAAIGSVLGAVIGHELAGSR